MEKDSGHVRFAAIEPPYLAMVWHQIGEYLEAALAHSAQREWTGAELFHRIAEREFLLLAAFVPAKEGDPVGQVLGGVVLNMSEGPGGRYIGVIACGGQRMDEWIERAIDVAFALGRKADCVDVVVVGRPGWVRKLSHRGLEARAVIAVAPIPAEIQEGADAQLLAGL